jgi:hypothetical protein
MSLMVSLTILPYPNARTASGRDIAGLPFTPYSPSE